MTSPVGRGTECFAAAVITKFLRKRERECGYCRMVWGKANDGNG